MSGDDAVEAVANVTNGAGDDTGAGDDAVQEKTGVTEHEEESPTAAAMAGPSNRVFVGNLSWRTSWQNLKDHMRSAGNVRFADIFYERTGGPDQRRKGWRPRSKGCGVVEYETVEDAQNAIEELNETELDGRKIFIQPDKKPDIRITRPNPGRRFQNGQRQAPRSGFRPRGTTRASECKVYIGNLNYSTSWQTLKDHMRTAGNVAYVDIFQGPDGRSKGCALVEFSSPEDAAKAIKELNDTTLDGRPIFIREDRPKQQRTSRDVGDDRAGDDDSVSNASSKERGPESQSDGTDGSAPSVKDDDGAEEDADKTFGIYVANLCYTVDDAQLTKHFEGFEYVDLEIQRNEHSKSSRGFALMTVATEDQRRKIIDKFNEMTKGDALGRWRVGRSYWPNGPLLVRNNREQVPRRRK